MQRCAAVVAAFFTQSQIAANKAMHSAALAFCIYRVVQFASDLYMQSIAPREQPTSRDEKYRGKSPARTHYFVT